MKQNRFTLFFVIGAIICAFVGLVFIKLTKHPLNFTEVNQVTSNANFSSVDFASHSAYLFTTSTCPHCKNVAKFINEHPEISRRLDLQTVELDNPITGEESSKKLKEFAQSCQLDTNQLAVPFLYLNDVGIKPPARCVFGDTAIIDHFELAVLSN